MQISEIFMVYITRRPNSTH